MYSYNLDVGENYYKPMSNYLDRNSSVERTARAETPGKLKTILYLLGMFPCVFSHSSHLIFKQKLIKVIQAKVTKLLMQNFPNSL